MKWPTINSAQRFSFMQIDAAGFAICLVLSAAAYFVGVRPLLAIRDERVARDESLRAAVEQASSLVSTTRGLRTQLTSAQNALAQIEIPLQPATSINQRVAELTTLAGECKLEMDAIQPGMITHSPRFGEIPIQISGTGTYRTMADFLHRLRGQFPDTSIRAFELSATPDDPSAVASFNVRLIWYVQPARNHGTR